MAIRKTLTRWAFRLHGWLGLTAGAFFLLFGLSGSGLLFRHELDRYFNPQWHQLTPGPTTVSVDSMYRNLVYRYPNLTKIVLHDFPQNARDSYEFMLYQNPKRVTDGYLYFVLVNPYTGQIVGEGGYDQIRPSFWRWLYSFHYSLQAGMPGKLLTAMLGIGMLLSLLTGLLIYRKHVWNVLCFRERLRFKNRRVAIASWHRVVGVWALLANVLLFGTGALMNVQFFTPSVWKLKPPITNYRVPVNLDSVLVRSRVVRGFAPIAVNIPTRKGEPVLVRGHFSQTLFFLYRGKASHVAFDARTGAVKAISDIDEQPAGRRFDWGVYQIHIGHFGGDGVRWLYVLLGLTPGLLSITGAWLWLRRKRVLKPARETTTRQHRRINRRQ